MTEKEEEKQRKGRNGRIKDKRSEMHRQEGKDRISSKTKPRNQIPSRYAMPSCTMLPAMPKIETVVAPGVFFPPSKRAQPIIIVRS
jgi:hypothetical protein